MGRKVAIVGTSPQNWHLAPFDDPTWEIWGISRLYTQMPRWNRWFELHRLNEVCRTWAPGQEETEARAREVYLSWLKNDAAPKPVYVQPQYADKADHWEPFPVQQILAEFPSAYFTNTISWLIALAILEDVDAIGVWGVDMAMSEEYGDQKPSCEYLLGLAQGRGIDVVVPKESNLLKARRLYAFDPPDQFMDGLKAKETEIQQRANQLEGEMKQGQIQLAAFKGFLEACEFFGRNWGD